MIRTLRYAIRSLVKSPMLTLVSTMTLALGIGVNAAMFSVVNAVFLKPLPFPEPERLVLAWSNVSDQPPGDGFTSYADFKDWREQSRSFKGMAAFWSFANGDVNLSGGLEPQRVSVARVTPDFFTVLGVQPIHGRAFLEEETVLGNHRRAILSFGLWQDQFGGDTSLIGRSVIVNAVPYTVVGVMPRDVQARAIRLLGTDVQLWRPLVPEDNQTGGRGSRRLRVIARLADGVTLPQAETELQSVAAGLSKIYPETNRRVSVQVAPLREQMVKNVRRGLYFLLAAVGVVLLGACANVANLLLIKSASRVGERAVRYALGASRGQLAMQVVAEALVLGVIGVAVGVLIALGLVKGFVAVGPSDLPLLADANIDFTVLGFAVGAALTSVLLASLAPSFRAAQSRSTQSRHNPGRARGRDDRRIMKSLSVIQISLAMLLLTIGSLLIQNFRALLSVDSGIQSDGVMTLQLELPMASTARYPNQVQRDEFFDVLLQRVEGLPTVVEAAIASAPPLEEEPSEFTLRLPEDAADVSRPANVRIVSENYFSLLRIPLVRGRNFNASDKRDGPGVVIVSTEFARNAWGAQDPIGKRIVMAPGREAEVIGVAASVRTGGLDTALGRTVYVSSTQGSYNFMTLLVRTTSNPTSLVPGIRGSVKDLDVTLPLHHVRPLESLVAGSVATQRFQMLLVAAFSMLMLVLALVGTYGVTAYGVNERTNELGIRAALGASSMDIQRLVLGESLRLALLGISIGAVAALALSKTLSHLVSELSALNLWSFSVAGVLLLAAMLFATLIPARRASTVNPMDALRAQ